MLQKRYDLVLVEAQFLRGRVRHLELELGVLRPAAYKADGNCLPSLNHPTGRQFSPSRTRNNDTLQCELIEKSLIPLRDGKQLPISPGTQPSRETIANAIISGEDVAL